MEEQKNINSTKSYKKRLLLSYLSSTLCLAMVLFMAGMFLMLFFNTQHISDMFRSNIKLTISLNNQKSQGEVNKFVKMVNASDFVRESNYISKEDAAKYLKDELGEDFVEILDKNPLYAQIEIKLVDNYSNMDSISSIEKQLKKYDVVDEVFYPKEVYRNASSVLNKIATVVFILTCILLTISILLIASTTKLQLSVHRFDIKTAKLIGASTWHISKPYLKRALIEGVAAIFISVFGLTLTIRFIEKIISGVFRISAFYPTLIVMVFLAFAVTLLSAWFTINKYLNQQEEELYY